MTGEFKKQYKPFYSVQPFETVPWELLDQLIKSYCPLPTPLILDSTVNKGRIWGSSNIKYIGMDIDPFVRPNLVGSNTQMPFPNDTFDVIVYDPPHTGEQGNSTVGFAEKYGVGVSVNKQGNLFDTYPP